MSYILNALRKSEQARQSEQTPTLKSSILHPQQQPESKRGLLVALILGNVIVLALFFLYFQQPEPETPQPAATPSRTAVPSTNSTAGNQPPAVKKSLQKPDSEVVATQAVTKPMPVNQDTTLSIAEMLDKRKAHKSAEQAVTSSIHPTLTHLHNKTQATEPVHKPEPISLATASGNKQAITESETIPVTVNSTAQADNNIQASQKKPHPSTDVPASHNAAVKQPEPTNSEPLPNNAVATKTTSPPVLAKPQTEPSIPLLKKLPYSFRRTVPELDINVYVYSEQARDRFIMVDMVRYTEGQQIADGLLLKEIRPDSLVVTFSGKTFRIKRP